MEGGKARFVVPVPFGRGVRLWADATSADGDRWSVASVTLDATDEPLSLLKPCHAWVAANVSFDILGNRVFAARRFLARRRHPPTGSLW